jgi:hypothetical protein
MPVLSGAGRNRVREALQRKRTHNEAGVSFRAGFGS